MIVKKQEKSMKKISNEEQRDRISFDETSYLIISSSYYSIFSGTELLDLYVEVSQRNTGKNKTIANITMAVL